jgi:hypothetical protein
MSKPLTKRELLEAQVKTYEFYAGLIDRAVTGTYGPNAKLVKWDEQRALEYRHLADELRAQLAALDEEEANAPAIDPGVTEEVESPTGVSDHVSSPEAG